MWGAFAAYVGWWFFWAWWLWPTWWWIVPIAVLPVLTWWFFDTGQTTYDIVGPKLCFLLPWLYVPAFAYGFYVYCIYWYSYQTF
jgi:hypothetical protein